MLKCKGCGADLDEVIRRVETDSFCDVDHEARKIKLRTVGEGDIEYRCPRCDWVVDDLLQDYEEDYSEV